MIARADIRLVPKRVVQHDQQVFARVEHFEQFRQARRLRLRRVAMQIGRDGAGLRGGQIVYPQVEEGRAERDGPLE